jgi:hypothetical protein
MRNFIQYLFRTLHDAVVITLFVVLPQPKRKNLHDLKETKDKLW